jgi:threonine dehydratase
MHLPTFPDVEAAALRIAGIAVRTPLLESEALNRRVGARVLVKAECLQVTGSFKIRGATNRLIQLTPEERGRGVVAFSSGNHAQGVARAGRLLGIPTRIVVPSDAPALKIAGARADGAEIITYDRVREDREAIAARIARETGATVVPSFDDPDIIAGQGTAGLEMAAQAEQAGVRLDAAYCCVGGGGLIAGAGLALGDRMPGTKLYGAEPEGHDDHARSLALGTGERLANPPGVRSICDALLSERPGALTFALNSRQLAGVAVVSDADILRAMAVAFLDLKLVVEPGGAAALAAVLAGHAGVPKGGTVGVLVTGGNVDPPMFARALAPEG